MGDYQELKTIRVAALLQGHLLHKRVILEFRPSFIFAKTCLWTRIICVRFVRVGPERSAVGACLMSSMLAVHSQLHVVNFRGVADGAIQSFA